MVSSRSVKGSRATFDFIYLMMDGSARMGLPRMDLLWTGATGSYPICMSVFP